jgi:signal transduction histidine kinase
MAVVGTFASGLAHEVRNPLNSINLQLSILERRLGRMDPGGSGELRELTGVIREEITRLDGLVGDFLQFSRTNRVQHVPQDLDVLIDEVVRLLRPEARASQVTLRRQRSGDPMPQLRIDAERMKQVVLNLVQNAIEAMPEGGVVTIESGLVQGRAQFVVRDQGPGLPPDLDVFQLFVTTKPKGTGLGLSIAQQVVLEHGGEIAARNEAAGGAAFVVSLPTGPPDGGRQERIPS